MTELEFKQACARMSPAQLLPYLYHAEKATNVVWPIMRRNLQLESNVIRATDGLSIDVHSAKIKTVITIVLGVAGLSVYFFSTINRGILLPLILRLFSYFLLICFIVALITLLPAWKDVKELKKRIPAYKAELAEAKSELIHAKAAHNDGLLIADWICPQECRNPQHMRVFVSFFEDGRVDNLKGARNLFDTYIHRQKMEEAVNVQIATARAAAIAANDAKIAAQNAASNAQQARDSADRAYWK